MIGSEDPFGFSWSLNLFRATDRQIAGKDTLGSFPTYTVPFGSVRFGFFLGRHQEVKVKPIGVMGAFGVSIRYRVGTELKLKRRFARQRPKLNWKRTELNGTVYVWKEP